MRCASRSARCSSSTERRSAAGRSVWLFMVSSGSLLAAGVWRIRWRGVNASIEGGQHHFAVVREKFSTYPGDSQMPVATTVNGWGDALMASFTGAMALFFAAIPKIIGFAIILIVGWFVAALLARAVGAIL